MNITPKRKRILEVLRSTKRVLTAQDIHELLPEVDVVTIYRNLSLFEQEGLVREIILPSKESAYEYITDSHHHLFCRTCDNVRHIALSASQLKAIPGLSHFDPTTVEITIRGKCK